MPHLRRLVIATENPGRLAADADFEYRVHDPESNGIDLSQKAWRGCCIITAGSGWPRETAGKPRRGLNPS